jgi:chromosome partitioning protein
MTTIAIVSQKGGTGKTTLALHLGAAAERQGEVALIIDADPQASASQWAAWRDEAPPEVIDCAPPRIAAKITRAYEAGATFIAIDTPPHSDATASQAMASADVVLIPCRPSAFDLAAIRTTARLVQLLAKPAWVVFTAGPPQAERIYADAAALVAGFGLDVCPHRVADRAIFRHASAAGKTVFELEPAGKAAREIERVHMWLCEQVKLLAQTTVAREVA